MEGKTPPAQVAAGANHHVCKRVFALVDGRKSPPVQGAKVKLEQDAATACNYNYHTIDLIGTSTGAVGVPDAAINATCIWECHITSTCPYVMEDNGHVCPSDTAIDTGTTDSRIVLHKPSTRM